MKYVEITCGKLDERYFSDVGKAQMKQIKAIAESPRLKSWISNRFEKYILSSDFDCDTCLIRKYETNFDYPEKYKNKQIDKPVYEVILDNNKYVFFRGFVSWLNTQDIEQISNWDVKYALRLYDNQLRDISKLEKIREVLATQDKKYKWVKLINKEALVNEGRGMQHCSGNGDTPHIQEMLEGKYTFLSLRESKNTKKPHVTIKYNSKSKIIVDLVGKQNSKPDERYYKYIIEIMNYLKLRPQIPSAAPYRYFIYDDDTDTWRYNK